METSGQNHLEGLIVTLYMFVSQVAGGSLAITASPMFPLESTPASLTCHIPLFTGGAEWIKKGSSLTVCLPGSCIPPSSTRCQYSANDTSITVTIPSLDKAHDEGTWTCAYNGGTDTGIYYLTVYSTTSTSSPPNALGKPDGAVFIILGICIIIFYIIMVILIIDLTILNKNSTISIFMSCIKTGHRCLCILYIVLVIVVAVCEIIIIIMIIIGTGCQCQTILIVGLVLCLIIIAVTIIFVIVFIQTGVIICNKDTVRNPRTSTDVKITAYLRPMFISDLEWIGPKGNTLSAEDEEKYIIAKYNINTGETSLTITNVSPDDNGLYICQAKIGCKIAKDSVHIMCDKEMKMKNSGNRSDVSRRDVEIQMEEKRIKGDEERPPVIYIGTQNKVESKPTSMKISDRCQPLPPVAAVTEDIPKRRPHPPTPENSDAKDPNKQGISANFDDSRGLPTDIPRSSRLLPLTHNQSTLEEEDASEKLKKKRKIRKKRRVRYMKGNQKKEQMNQKVKEYQSADD